MTHPGPRALVRRLLGSTEPVADRHTRPRLLAPQAELDARDQRSWVSRYASAPIDTLQPRRRARVAGVVRSVTYAPSGRATELRAELFDGTGSLTLCWTGRRDVAGVAPGRRMVVTGMVARAVPERPALMMYNPQYELLTVSEVPS